MRAPSSTEISLFGSFRLDHRSGVLFRRDERGVFTPLAMGSRALGILGVLLARPGELVSRAEIIAAVWPGTAVEDSNLNVQIAALRRVLREGQAERSCIQTIPGHGYRFTAPVTRVAADASSPPAGGLPPLPTSHQSRYAVRQYERRSGAGYFADGIVEEIITALSRIRWLFVIARNSSFT